MSELVRFKSADGQELLVEVDENQFGIEQIGRDSRGMLEATETLESAIDRTVPALERITALLRELAPDEHQVEFGLKLNAEAGAIVAKTSAEGHFSVKMTWRRRTEP